jgi:adenosylhomocysteine nucleosidase
METWLIVAAEAREFDGILKRAGQVSRLAWPGAAFARAVDWRGNRWFLVANGPGPRLVGRITRAQAVDGVMSIGFCGALDPALHIGDIVIEGETPKILSVDRVAVTAQEKSRLREITGAAVIEMESAAVAEKAREWGVQFRCIRVVSDTAGENMPLDFNCYRDADGRFQRGRIALAALGRPFTVIPALLRLEFNCRRAAESLGRFLADCQV